VQAIVVFVSFAVLALPSSGGATTLNVRDVVRQGLVFHPTLQSAQAAIQQAEGEKLTAISPTSPVLAVEREGVPRGGSLSEYGEQRIAISQELEFPLKSVWRASSARTGVAASRQNAIAQLLDLEAEIRGTFTEAYLLDQKVTLLTENVEAVRVYSTQLERMVELGEAVPLEARRARVEYLQAKSLLDAVSNERFAVRTRLGRLTGMDLNAATLESPGGEDVTTKSAPVDATLSENPDLRAATLGAEQSATDLQIARFGWLPDLEVSYFQQKAPAEPKPDFWGVEVGLSLPIWFWLGGRGEIESSSARRRASSAELANLRLEAASELDRLTQSINALRESYRLYQSEVAPAAKEAYDLAMRSFRLGEANYLQVLDAQRSALGVQMDLIEVQGELSINLVELDRLTGRSLLGADELQNLLNKGK